MSNQQTWETHQMDLLLSNTQELYIEARPLAQQDSTGEALRRWVDGWFWGPLGHLSGTTRGAVEWLLDNMSKGEYARIDWADVADTLGTE